MDPDVNTSDTSGSLEYECRCTTCGQMVAELYCKTCFSAEDIKASETKNQQQEEVDDFVATTIPAFEKETTNTDELKTIFRVVSIVPLGKSAAVAISKVHVMKNKTIELHFDEKQIKTEEIFPDDVDLKKTGSHENFVRVKKFMNDMTKGIKKYEPWTLLIEQQTFVNDPPQIADFTMKKVLTWTIMRLYGEVQFPQALVCDTDVEKTNKYFNTISTPELKEAEFKKTLNYVPPTPKLQFAVLHPMKHIEDFFPDYTIKVCMD